HGNEPLGHRAGGLLDLPERDLLRPGLPRRGELPERRLPHGAALGNRPPRGDRAGRRSLRRSGLPARAPLNAPAKPRSPEGGANAKGLLREALPSAGPVLRAGGRNGARAPLIRFQPAGRGAGFGWEEGAVVPLLGAEEGALVFLPSRAWISAKPPTISARPLAAFRARMAWSRLFARSAGWGWEAKNCSRLLADPLCRARVWKKRGMAAGS